jgi:hypothetical protein
MVNAAIIWFGTGWVPVALPFIAALLTLLLAYLVFRTQRHIWRIDLQLKEAGSKSCNERPVS